MAEVIWTLPALSDLERIADYIALDKPEAAGRLVRRVFDHVDQLEQHPDSGSKPPELKGWRCRQVVEPPCRVFYRHEDDRVYILHVMRSERKLRRSRLVERAKATDDRSIASDTKRKVPKAKRARGQSPQRATNE
jgi:plasmid stabilization system protein ParE